MAWDFDKVMLNNANTRVRAILKNIVPGVADADLERKVYTFTRTGGTLAAFKALVTREMAAHKNALNAALSETETDITAEIAG